MRITHVSDKCQETLSLIEKINNGSKLDLGFFEVLPDTITVIAGRSGSGKSLLLDNIRNKIFSQEGFCVLSFELEMLPQYQILRTVAASKGERLDDLLNGQLTSSQLEDIRRRPQYYVDYVSSVDEVVAITQQFVRESSYQKIVVTIDHALLVDISSGEKNGLDNLMLSLIQLKKVLSTWSKEIYFVILSQLNRNIEGDERITNPFSHIPKRSDIHGSSAIFTAADYVFVIHSPATIAGFSSFYTWKKLPVYHEGKMIVWIHQLKNRFGRLIHVECLEDFDKATLIYKQVYDDRYFSEG